MTTAADIDALLAERTSIAGAARWIVGERGSVASLAVSLAAHGAVGALGFCATALVHDVLQSGSCALVFEGRPIQRLSFRPTHAHVNPFGPGVAERLRGLRFPAGRSRIHPWSENRAWPRPRDDDVAVAEPTTLEGGGLNMGLAIFVLRCNVDGALPPAPWGPRLL